MLSCILILIFEAVVISLLIFNTVVLINSTQEAGEIIRNGAELETEISMIVTYVSDVISN